MTTWNIHNAVLLDAVTRVASGHKSTVEVLAGVQKRERSNCDRRRDRRNRDAKELTAE